MSEALLPPAPGTQKHLSLDLVNSVLHLPGGKIVDELDSPEETTAWLKRRELVDEDAALQSYCQNRLSGLRADLREAFSMSAAQQPFDPQILERLNKALTAAPHIPLLRYSPDNGFYRSTEHPVTRLVEYAMSVITEDAATLLASEESALLAQCEAEPCQRFLLRTHGRRQWCSTRCGDRVRAARAYARKREKALKSSA
ncbi:hypothetical protein CQ010_06095 [Arthrobacter sp. MYb211]|uniref:CGNR zinc finger domain-containing protein n=1 Tax=Micrococcaceae TaxID=1268 RepID=UPI000CFD54C5|nr:MULTISPECIES: CGNR zinc finger domain-containing protein [unclassified Arthrobacter]PRA04486.1 hypothetical protein CQ019_09185 [Arthrobacter sp. MYb229]PRA12220.1 hypothetical protein CQ015_06790 [Arthrobacter sp. MYb221]PRB51601.1 hypothetical protein CQ013_07380 [Arthrobacter sp. MYb216]PRC08682.1 hypothetical protein CQ010_06095 [Arthrobacter sp. MYb211]